MAKQTEKAEVQSIHAEMLEKAVKQISTANSLMTDANATLTFRKKLSDEDIVTLNDSVKEATTISLKKSAVEVRTDIKEKLHIDITKAYEKINANENKEAVGLAKVSLMRLQARLGKGLY